MVPVWAMTDVEKARAAARLVRLMKYIFVVCGARFLRNEVLLRSRWLKKECRLVMKLRACAQSMSD